MKNNWIGAILIIIIAVLILMCVAGKGFEGFLNCTECGDGTEGYSNYGNLEYDTISNCDYKKKFNYRTGSGMLYFPNYWYKMNWNKRGCCQGF